MLTADFAFSQISKYVDGDGEGDDCEDDGDGDGKKMRAVASMQSNGFANAEYISQFMLILIGFAYNDDDDNDKDDNDDQKDEDNNDDDKDHVFRKCESCSKRKNPMLLMRY